jgi:hypothetical protein
MVFVRPLLPKWSSKVYTRQLLGVLQTPARGASELGSLSLFLDDREATNTLMRLSGKGYTSSKESLSVSIGFDLERSPAAESPTRDSSVTTISSSCGSIFFTTVRRTDLTREVEPESADDNGHLPRSTCTGTTRSIKQALVADLALKELLLNAAWVCPPLSLPSRHRGRCSRQAGHGLSADGPWVHLAGTGLTCRHASQTCLFVPKATALRKPWRFIMRLWIPKSHTLADQGGMPQPQLCSRGMPPSPASWLPLPG